MEKYCVHLVGIKRSDCLQECMVWKASKNSVRVLNTFYIIRKPEQWFGYL